MRGSENGRSNLVSLRTVATFFLLFALWPGRAEAYLDPGTGSFLIQAVVAVLAGVAVALRTYWSRVKSFLGLSSPDGEEAGAEAPSGDD